MKDEPKSTESLSAALEKVEAALSESEKRFRTLFEQSPFSIQLLSVDGKTIRVNSAWKRLWELPEDFIENFILKEYNLLEDPVLTKNNFIHIIRDAFNGKGGMVPPVHYDPSEVGGTGRKRWVEGYIHPILDENKKVREVVLIHQDVTEKIEFQNELKKAKDAAEEANRLKSAFLANMSHEIRTPLGAILGFSEMLKDPSLAPDDKLDYLDIIDRSGKALTKIIDDILDLSKVEAGRLKIETLPVDVISIVHEVVSLLKVQANKHRIQIDVIEPEQHLGKILTDPARIRQILINLIGNAIKFTEDGNIKILVQTSLSQKSVLKISIVDTGAGISSNQQLLLFRPFSQADNSSTRQFGGTGLGLALSKRLAQAMNGDVYLEKSDLGKGSVFVLELPYNMEKPAVNRNSASAMTSPSINLQGLKALIVDDSEDNRKLVERILKKQGVQTTEAVHGAEGVTNAQENPYDIILMDIQMPVMDGLEAIQTLRKHHINTPIIAVTAHAMPEEKERCINAGADAHLPKPINRQEFLRAIQILTTKSPFN
jgi:signal transduction histidine kinase